VGILRTALDVISIAIFYSKLIQCYPNTQLRRGDFDKYTIENAGGTSTADPMLCTQAPGGLLT
jgi:hypothetical protein